jgi:hypothetical protein
MLVGHANQLADILDRRVTRHDATGTENESAITRLAKTSLGSPANHVS